MEKQEQAFKVLKEIYKESTNFTLNCFEVCDGRCEAGDLLLAHPFPSPEWKQYYDSNFGSYKAVEIVI